MLIAGVDEAGRGPLAGPVVCAAVILAKSHTLVGLNDSKKLSEKKRESLFLEIQQQATAFSIISIDANTIDQLNIFQATMLGMLQALHALSTAPDLALIDGKHLPNNLPCAARAIIQGDALEPCIMAASILAKVSRDRLMRILHQQYPQYGFAQHKGYPTAQHIQALHTYGISPVHRLSYAPVKKRLAQ
jgi:ribonuclease HII